MNPTTRVVLWRHGQTDWNVARRFQGQADRPLNAQGVEQARRAAPYVAALAPVAILASPLLRARQTAEELSALTGLDVCTDPRLAEINVGQWAGQLAADVFAQPEIATARAEGRDFRYSSTGETRREVGERAAPAIAAFAHQHPGRTVAVVSHGVALRMAIAQLCGLDYQQAQDLGTMHNCAWSILESDDEKWQLLAWDQRADIE